MRRINDTKVFIITVAPFEIGDAAPENESLERDVTLVQDPRNLSKGISVPLDAIVIFQLLPEVLLAAVFNSHTIFTNTDGLYLPSVLDKSKCSKSHRKGHEVNYLMSLAMRMKMGDDSLS